VPLQPLRMVDANLNRSSEGLRVLEDVARFLLNDAQLSQQLRAIRHDLTQKTRLLDTGLLSQRDSEHDTGAGRDNVSYEGEAKQSQQDMVGIVIANAKRVEESLRVLEELSKLPEINLGLYSDDFKRARFTLYTLERDLVSKILRRDKLEQISGLYVILDRQVLAGKDEVAVASQIIRGGAKVIQLRDKQGSKRELLVVAQKLKDICGQFDVLFIINDYLDLVVAVDADGLHVGQGDLPVSVIRRELPIDKIVGCSVNMLSQAIRAEKEGADYIAVGSIFPTTTKEHATVVGVDVIKEIKRTVSNPLVAIGGINKDNIEETVAAGADSMAVISAVLCEEDIQGAVQQLITKISVMQNGEG